MRGDPLHLCAANHPTLLYTEAECPYCALRQQLEAALRRTRLLERKVPPEPKATEENPLCG